MPSIKKYLITDKILLQMKSLGDTINYTLSKMAAVAKTVTKFSPQFIVVSLRNQAG
jgi:hypothetical protein